MSTFSARLRALLSTALLAAFAPATALAQEGERSWYDIEIIVFEQQEAGGRDAERWSVTAPAPQADEVARLRAPGGQRENFVQLRSQDLRLLPLYRQLERASQYRPLLHLAWRQQGLSRESAPAVAIPPEWTPQPTPQGEVLIPELGGDLAATRSGPPLYGFVRLYRERYLHVGVDLRYHPEQADAAERYPYLEGRMPVYVMEQRRRMRSGELHYLDHPVLGVLVQVTPTE